jgi:hypothetical protein
VKHSKFKVHAHVSPTPMQFESPGSSVSGELHIEVDDLCFPTEGWHDYVTPVLCWWIENAMRVYLPDSEVKSICMDGAYEFSMRRGAGGDEVSLTLREDHHTVIGHFTVSYKRCLATLRGAAKSVINELAEMGLTRLGEASGLPGYLEQLERLESEIRAHGLP